ncbi:MAG: hypothetical protein ACI9UN_001637 [Granulosicoccus sp.]
MAARSTDAVINLIATQQYDVGLCDNHPDLKKEAGFVTTELIQYPCVCAIHYEDELAEKDVITLKHLDQKPMGTLFDDHASFLQLKDAFYQANLKLNPIFCHADLHSLIDLCGKKLSLCDC